MFLTELQFGRVLDGDDPLVVGNETGEDIERGGLSRTGTTRDHNVETASHTRPQEGDHVRGHRVVPHQVLNLKGVLGELTDGDRWAAQRERWDDHVHARTILETRVNH